MSTQLEFSSRRTSAKARASLALALVGGVFGLLLAPLLCSGAAVALGVSARRELSSDPHRRGRALASAGVVLGALGLVFWTGLWLAFLLSPSQDHHIGGAGGFF